MSVEKKLEEALKAGSKRGDKFHQQIAEFKDFEQRLKQGGLEIERKTFSIPLMERLGVSYLHTK
jgi:hypothetical protein